MLGVVYADLLRMSVTCKPLMLSLNDECHYAECRFAECCGAVLGACFI
jgi:hypothetical protein